MLSMKEIAERAGVSVATVSRVFNNSGPVSEKSRAKVRKCLEDSGYRMNFQARSLRTQRTRNIIALVPNLRNPMFSELVAGICEEARRTDWNILIASIEGDVSNVEPYIRMLETHQAEGIIFASKSFDSMTMEKVMGKYPFVLCNEMYPDERCEYVGIDNYDASCMATKYLVSRGLKKLGYIAGRTTSPSTYLRLKGFRDTLGKNGLEYSEKSVEYGLTGSVDDMPKIKEFLEKGRYDGLLVNSDIESALVIKCMIECMHESPDEIRLVSFDGSYITNIFVPAITSIIQPMEDIGTIAVDKLIAKIEKRETERITHVPYEFRVRNT